MLFFGNNQQNKIHSNVNNSSIKQCKHTSKKKNNTKNKKTVSKQAIMVNGKKKKKTIPKKIREQLWLNYNGEIFKSKCLINWCSNTIDVFNFHVGHDIPESQGGSLDLENLVPICDRCNLSMSDNYTIKEWNKLNVGKKKKNKLYLWLAVMCVSGLSLYYNVKLNLFH